MTAWNGSLDATSLAAAYASGQLTPVDVVETVLDRIDARGDDAVWIDRVPPDELRAAAVALRDGQRGDPGGLPLYGLPFAVKDNIDIAGRPTTAACPSFSFEADRSATVVERLIAAGALPVGKTNLDQFATGLVGTRSPYGAVGSAFDPLDISGGSSSGSAVAVAADLVTFALGTDTAGSGRIPASCNNVVGLKPTPGLVPTTGVLPACRSLDCVAVFALTVDDAVAVLSVIAGPDGQDAYATPVAPRLGAVPPTPPTFRFAVPDTLEFFGDDEVARVVEEAITRAESLGGVQVTVPFAPFQEVASLLYDGPWVAERLAELEHVLESEPPDLYPATRTILQGARRWTAVDGYRAMYRLQELRRETAPLWDDVDLLLLPTAGTTYSIAQVLDEPIALNSNLGYYTNFVNLLGLAALAVPAGFTDAGRPAGVTLVGPGGSDLRLAALGTALHAQAALPMGATGRALPEQPTSGGVGWSPATGLEIAVVGAHLSGQPLNHQLTELGASLLQTTQTAPSYRLFELDGGDKPGLVRVREQGHAVEVEVWDVPIDRIGRLLPQVGPPLSIGNIELASGAWVLGFLCEPYAVDGTADISHRGGWRQHLAVR